MRKVILAAALAAAFCLSQTSHAQQSGGGAGTGAPVGSAAGTAATPQGQGASGGAALGGPPAAGSFSVQPQSQVAGGQAPGAATGAGQTFYGPADPGTAGTGTGTGTGTGATGEGNVAGGDIATRSPRANERTSVGSASNDPQVELARLRAEVDQLRAELDEVKGIRRSNNTPSVDTGTGGSGSQQEQEQQPRPIASSMVEGRVSKVSKRSIEVIDSETGEPYVLRLNEDSRARSGQRRIPVTRIRQGSEVRASFDLVAGDTYATQINVVSKRRR